VRVDRGGHSLDRFELIYGTDLMGLLATIAKRGNSDSAASSSLANVNTPEEIQPMTEAGVSGLLRTKGTGYVYDEWLAALTAYRQRQVYREMRDNDAVIGSMFFALEMILRRAKWSIDPAKGSKGEELAKFVKDCMDDMSHPWTDMIAECVSMFAFGFSLFETVYKRRQGQTPGTYRDDEGNIRRRPASKFDDGLIGWRKHAPRAQESILYWKWDDEGGLQGAVQLAAPDWIQTTIPIEKLLLFRTTSLKSNPEGRSVLRNSYRAWSFKKRTEEVEGIGIERDICGMPVLYISKAALAQMGGGSVAAGESLARKMVRNIRIDDQMGVILPQAFDEKGNRQVDLQLVKAAGAKQTDVHATIARYNADILSTILAGFIGYGQTEHGSRSLHLSATQIFAEAIAAYLDSIADVFNRIAIPRLLAINGMDLSLAPKLVPGDVGVRDLEELGTYVQQLAAAGIPLADSVTASFLRKVANLPEQPEETLIPGDPLDDYSGAGEEEAPQPTTLQAPTSGKKPAPTGSTAPKDTQQAGDRLAAAV